MKLFRTVSLLCLLIFVGLLSACSSFPTKVERVTAPLKYLNQQDIDAFNKSIEAPEVNYVLSAPEKNMLDSAKGYLLGLVPKDTAITKLRAMETELLKFALDADQVQILRETPTDYVRMGFRRSNHAALIRMGKPSIFVQSDVAKEAPNTYKLLHSLHKQGMPLIAILGKARIAQGEDIIKAIEVGSKAMDYVYWKRPVAFLTGGYKGASDGVYGYTRIGYERAKDLAAYTTVVMPAAGKKDSHQYVDAKDISGEMWGDDTPTLTKLADAAMVFAWYGSWTKVEIDTLLYNKKPVVIINPYQDKDVMPVQGKKGQVQSYRDPLQAAKALYLVLPSKQDLIRHAPKDAAPLPKRKTEISDVEYYPLPGWFDKSKPAKTATSRVAPLP